MKCILAIALALSVSSCSLSTPGVEYPEACGYYDTAYLGWSATASAASGLAGAAATGASVVGGVLDGDEARDATIGLGVSGAVLGVVATVAGLLAGEYAARFTANCGGLEIAGNTIIESDVSTTESLPVDNGIVAPPEPLPAP